MKISKAIELAIFLLKDCYNTLFVSRPGIGKSYAAEQIAKTLDFDLITFYPLFSEPIEFKGFPVNSPDSEFAEFKVFGDLGKLYKAEKPVIAFFDELGQALTSTQAAVANLIQSRQVNSKMISPQVRFLAATNRKEDKSAVSGMLQHLKDRFYAILQIDFDMQDFLNYGLKNDFDSTLLAFCKFRPNYLEDYKPSLEISPTISPRKIEFFSNTLKKGFYDIDLTEGMLGKEFAVEFDAFKKSLSRLPDLNTILNGSNTTYNFPPDILYVILIALCKKLDHINCNNVCTFISKLSIEFQGMFFALANSQKSSIISANPFYVNWLTANNNSFTF